MGGARDAQGVRGHDGCSDRMLPFLHLFLFSVSYVHRNDDIKAEIHGRMVQVIGGGVDRGGADATIHSGGSGSGRYEETVRACRGLLTVKTLQESMSRQSSTLTLTLGPGFE